MATVSVRYIVDDVDAAIDFYTGVGGKQILVEDPAGNPVELFEPTRDEARLRPTS
jgi:hypothetical protein